MNFCPHCGQSLLVPRSLVVEYWVAEHTVYFCWCSSCLWRGEIKAIDRVTTTEMEEEEGGAD